MDILLVIILYPFIISLIPLPASLRLAPRLATLAGAGLDVFEKEPTPADNPLLKLDNVIVAPHALAWTDELFGNIARTAIAAVVAVHNGRRPQFLVNPAALAHPRAKAWLKE